MAVTVLAQLAIKPGHFDDVSAALAELVPLVWAEEGCINYDYYSVEGDPTTIYFIENWADHAALQAHGKQPHMHAVRLKIADFLTAPTDIKLLSKVGA